MLAKRAFPFLLGAMLALPAMAQERAKVGDKMPDATFEFLNGDGRTKLSEFFGQPIVLDNWGTH
jgi:hypothetical protein